MLFSARKLINMLISRFKSVFMHQGFRRYATNTSWLIAENLLRLIAGLFVGIYVARYLGPEQFGIYSYALAFVAMFSAIAKLGLDSIVVRDLVKDERQLLILGTSFWLKLIGAALAIASILVVLNLIETDKTTSIYICIIAIGMLFQSLEVVDFYFQSKVLSRYVSLCKLTQLLLSTLLKIYCIFIQADLIWFVVISVVDQASLALSLAIAFSSRKLGNFLFRFDLNIAKSLFQESWPLIVAGIGVMLYMRIDQIMIEHYLGNEAVGLFSAAVRLSEAIYFIPTIICSSIFPALVAAKQRSNQEFNAKSALLFEIMTLLALCAAIPISLLSSWIIRFTFGSEYTVASDVLQIHIWASVFVFLGVAGSRWLIAEKLAIQSMYRTLAGACCNTGLNLYFIPKFGIVGAAYSTLISQFIASIGINALNPKTRSCFLLQIKSILLPCGNLLIHSKLYLNKRVNN